MIRSGKLELVSYLAPNLFWFYKAVGACLERALNIETQLVQSAFDPLNDPLLQQDHWDIAFICGLPLVRYGSIVPNQLRPFAAPVMAADRYQDCPVYFSDVIVQAASGLVTFADLAGKTLCYNDLGSNSGYNLLRQRLMQGNHPNLFFGQAIPSGSHQHSIQWVTKGLADCAAIDSTVLEQELRDFPELAHHLRVVDSIGPCPMPPVVAAQRLGEDLIHQIKMALLQPDADLQKAMSQAQIQRYAAVEFEDYRAIATLYDTALKAGYEIIG